VDKKPVLPRDIVDHIAAFVGVLDLDGTVAQVNETTLKISGSQRHELIGTKLWDLSWFTSDPESAARVKHAVTRAAKGETVRFDTTVTTHGGERLAIDLMIHPVLDEKTGKVQYLVPSGINITRRKAIEAELKRSRDLLERAQRVGHLGHWSFDLATKKLEWSAEARRIFFGEEESREVSAETIEKLIHPDDLERVRAGMMAAIQAGESFATSYRIRRGDGEERIIELQADPDYAPDGELLRVFGIVRDVTQAHLREQQLIEQQQLIDLSLEPILCWSLDDGLLHWNPGCQHLYGYSREEALGHRIDELLHSQFPVPIAEIRKRLEAGESWTGEVIQTAKDGRKIIVEARIDPVVSGERRIVMEAHRDITARRQAEQALKLSEERLAIATKLAGVGFFDHDQIADVIYFSPEPWAGMLPTEATLDDVFAIVHPDDLAPFREAIAKAHDPRGTGQLEHEYRMIRKTGEIRWISVKSRTFFEGEWKERRPVRTVGAVVDVTEQRMWAEQQRLLMGELNHRVRNTLSVVQAIATQTLRTAKDPQAFVQDFKGRLQAIASAHKLLNETTWQGANLTGLVREQLASSCGSGQVYTDGPEVWLPPQVALNLGLVLYELATNARKHGALSVANGRVQLSWQVVREDDKRVLRLTWQECGGPAVRPPISRGFGMGLIERTMGSAADGAARIAFEPEGLRCVIDIALQSAERFAISAP
jgi:PAS domain S-box-containing protein